VTSVVRGRDDMLKSLGMEVRGMPIIMTDESGQLVGAGRNGEMLTKSMAAIDSMRSSQQLGGRSVKKPVVLKRHSTLAKSMSDGFDGILRRLDSLKSQL
jgi:hypothetical protein